MEEDIYANAEDFNLQEMRTKGRNPETGPSPFLPSGAADRCCRWTVGLGLLCVLLLGLSIGLAVWLLTERDQLLTNQNNLLEERDQLLTNQSSLTMERDQLLTHNIFPNERNQLCIKFHGTKYVPRCPSGWEVFGCTCYHNGNVGKSWSDSRNYCQSLGGDLVILNTPEKQRFITDKYYAGWIGVKKESGVWRWIDGTPVSTWYWRPGQPDSSSADCVVIHQWDTTYSNWYDYSCSKNNNWALCEKPVPQE